MPACFLPRAALLLAAADVDQSLKSFAKWAGERQGGLLGFSHGNTQNSRANKSFQQGLSFANTRKIFARGRRTIKVEPMIGQVRGFVSIFVEEVLVF